MVRPLRHPWVCLLPLSLSLVLLGLCAVPTVSAFYGVAVPAALTFGSTPVPNEDCIFLLKCAPLGTDELEAILSSTIDVDAARPLYVGRAAGRCQRRLDEIKCALKALVVQENECRAATWPDVESAPGQRTYIASRASNHAIALCKDTHRCHCVRMFRVAALPAACSVQRRSIESCIVQHCQGTTRGLVCDSGG